MKENFIPETNKYIVLKMRTMETCAVDGGRVLQSGQMFKTNNAYGLQCEIVCARNIWNGEKLIARRVNDRKINQLKGNTAKHIKVCRLLHYLLRIKCRSLELPLSFHRRTHPTMANNNDISATIRWQFRLFQNLRT